MLASDLAEISNILSAIDRATERGYRILGTIHLWNDDGQYLGTIGDAGDSEVASWQSPEVLGDYLGPVDTSGV